MPSVELYHGNCLDIMPGADAVISDPPWGSNTNCDYTRFSGGITEEGRQAFGAIRNDDRPFDPSPWLEYSSVVLWGYQHFAQRLPVGTVLVWLKKRDSQLASVLSDAELAWQKGGQGVYVFRHIWNGFDRESERGERPMHPTQKPIALFRWCIERITEPGDTVIDPYMGSGPCGVACVQTGRNFIGIEIDPGYFDIAKARIEKAQQEVIQGELCLVPA